MDELSGGAQRLIEAAMAEDEPPADATETGWSEMADRLSRSDLPRETPSAPVEAGPSALPRWLMLPAAIALAGVIAWVVTHTVRDDEVRDASPPTSARGVAPAKVAPVDDVREPPTAPAPPSEAALIDEAAAALAKDDATLALEVLDRHALRFPMGERADERLELRIRALCALGRTTEAKAEVAGVRRIRPDAAALQRLADTCAAE